MKRREFLKLLGVGVGVATVGLPTKPIKQAAEAVVEFHPVQYSRSITISKELLDDNVFDLQAMAQELYGQRLRQAWDDEFARTRTHPLPPEILSNSRDINPAFTHILRPQNSRGGV